MITALLIGALLARLAYVLPRQSSLAEELEQLKNDTTQAREIAELRRRLEHERSQVRALSLQYEGLRRLATDFAHEIEVTFLELRAGLHDGEPAGSRTSTPPRIAGLMPIVRSGEQAAERLAGFASPPRLPGLDTEVRRLSLQDLLSSSLAGSGTPRRVDVRIPGDLPLPAVEPQRTEFVIRTILASCRALMREHDRLRIEAHRVEATGAGTETPGRPPRAGVDRGSLRNTSDHIQVVFSGVSETLDRASLSALFHPSPAIIMGAGAGVGFAAAKEIMRRQKGAFAVASDGEGTRFTLTLPVVAPQTPSAETASPTDDDVIDTPTAPRRLPPSRKPGPPSQSRGRVLVMDDEQSILSLLSAALRRLGFEPVTTEKGEDALSATREAIDRGKPFLLAILDLTIPGGMGGVETAENLGRLQPDMILIASSGYAQNPALIDFKAYGFDEALVKPYRIPDLARLLDRLLQEDGADDE